MKYPSTVTLDIMDWSLIVNALEVFPETDTSSLTAEIMNQVGSDLPVAEVVDGTCVEVTDCAHENVYDPGDPENGPALYCSDCGARLSS